MPLHSERPIVRVEPNSMRTIETSNTENLFGLWSVFARCSIAMEDGKRYENMAWRLWSRETFCCQPDHIIPPKWSFERKLSSSTTDMPELSSSVASDDSYVHTTLASNSRSDLDVSRPEIRRHDSATSQARGKHLTPMGLEKVVNSIQEKKFIEPLSPLPQQLAPLATHREVTADTTPRAASPPPTARRIPESSTSTVATTMGSEATSPPVGSEASTSTEFSEHSIVRGFEPGHMSTSIRSSTNLNPTPILKKTSSFLSKPPPTQAAATKKKQPMFTLGASSDEDNCSSLEFSMGQRSSLSERLKRAAPPMRKTTSFKHEVSTRTIQDISESEGAIESDSDEDFDESAIEDDDSEAEWEDDDGNEESNPSSIPEFQRVNSSANLASRRSLLTTALHQGDRAMALQNAASKSTSAIRRSHKSTPNGPSTGNSPQEDSGLMMASRQQSSRPKPIIMTTSNVHPPAMSPKTTRRLMLQSELSGSLRQHMIWERQQKNATTNASMRRAMTTTDIKGMAAMPQQKPVETTRANNSLNDYFAEGLHEYHTKGW